MFACPNCNTQNEDGSRFCISCGQVLDSPAPFAFREIPPPQAMPAAPSNPAGRMLGIATGRVLIGILLVWFLRAVMLSFSFAGGEIFSDFAITVESLITVIAYLAIIAMLISYANSLRTYWPRAFPQASSATTALTAIVYLIVLVMAYKAFLPFLVGVLDNSFEVIRWLNVLLSLIALALLAWAVKVIYDALPAWLNGIRFDGTPTAQGTIACLNCGRLNPLENDYCGHCGHELAQAK